MTTENKTIADAMKVEEKPKSIGIPISECGEGILQPHVKYEWRINFSGENGKYSLKPKNVKSCSRPTCKFIELAVGDGAGKHVSVAGKGVWQPLTINFNDKIDSIAMEQIQKQLQLQNESIMGGTSVPYKFTTDLVLLDPTDKSIQELWTLSGCFIQMVEYSSFECGDSDSNEVELSIRYDHGQML